VPLPGNSAQELRECLYGIGASQHECGVLGRLCSGSGQSLGWPARPQYGGAVFILSAAVGICRERVRMLMGR